LSTLGSTCGALQQLLVVQIVGRERDADALVRQGQAGVNVWPHGAQERGVRVLGRAQHQPDQLAIGPVRGLA
jgi:hypothetical protein